MFLFPSNIHKNINKMQKKVQLQSVMFTENISAIVPILSKIQIAAQSVFVR